MNSKKRGLNRGLEVLLADTGILEKSHVMHRTQSISNPDQIPTTLNLSNFNIEHVSIDKLAPTKLQPRSSIEPEELNNLVQSIKNHGILQPLIVRKLPKFYEIIAGERRWRAANIAGLTTVPVICKNINDAEALTIALIENIQRENLNPLEEALALNRLVQEFGLTHNEVAIAVGKSRTTITNLLRILQLPKELQTMLSTQQLELGHAKILAGQEYTVQLNLAHKIAKENLSVRATENLLKKYLNDHDVNAKNEHSNSLQNNPPPPDPDLKRLQQYLSDFFATKVRIEFNKPFNPNSDSAKHKGKLIINYNSLEEFEGILARCGCHEFEL